MGDDFVWVLGAQDDGGEVIIDGQRYDLDEILQEIEAETITRSATNTIETASIAPDDAGQIEESVTG